MSDDLTILKLRYEIVLAERDTARMTWRMRLGEAKELKRQITALGRMPRAKRARGLLADDDLTFLFQVQRYPREPEARRLEKRRRRYLREILERTWRKNSITRHGEEGFWDLHHRDRRAPVFRDFIELTPHRELVRLCRQPYTDTVWSDIPREVEAS